MIRSTETRAAVRSHDVVLEESQVRAARCDEVPERADVREVVCLVRRVLGEASSERAARRFVHEEP